MVVKRVAVHLTVGCEWPYADCILPSEWPRSRFADSPPQHPKNPVHCLIGISKPVVCKVSANDTKNVEQNIFWNRRDPSDIAMNLFLFVHSLNFVRTGFAVGSCHRQVNANFRVGFDVFE
jgi:hypothetical protein